MKKHLSKIFLFSIFITVAQNLNGMAFRDHFTDQDKINIAILKRQLQVEFPLEGLPEQVSASAVERYQTPSPSPVQFSEAKAAKKRKPVSEERKRNNRRHAAKRRTKDFLIIQQKEYPHLASLVYKKDKKFKKLLEGEEVLRSSLREKKGFTAFDFRASKIAFYKLVEADLAERGKVSFLAMAKKVFRGCEPISDEVKEERARRKGPIDAKKGTGSGSRGKAKNREYALGSRKRKKNSLNAALIVLAQKEQDKY
jgi:hypothetical protein